MPHATDPLVAWVEAAGARLPAAFDGEAMDPEALSLLDATIAGADLVFLGEMDHFVHEKADFRLLFCRYLLSRGRGSFAEELSWSDGARVARYLATGDEAILPSLSLFGYLGDLRDDRDDRPTGVFKASFDVYPGALMAAEQGRFYRGLRRAAAGGRPLAYHGVDIDALPGGAYADIDNHLTPFAERPEVVAFLAALARVPGETAAEEAARLTALAPRAAALEPMIGDAAAKVEVALAATAESLDYIQRTYAAKTYEATAPGMAFREGCMKRRFDDMRRLTGGAPAVLMGHALHLAKDDRLLSKAPGVGPGGGLEWSLGHHLVQTLGLKTVSIWLVHGAGEDSQPFLDLPRHFAYPPETLNARLSVFDTPVLFPIKGAPAGLFDRQIGVGHMYNTIQPVALAGQVDAILYLPRVGPLRPA